MVTGTSACSAPFIADFTVTSGSVVPPSLRAGPLHRAGTAAQSPGAGTGLPNMLRLAGLRLSAQVFEEGLA